MYTPNCHLQPTNWERSINLNHEAEGACNAHDRFLSRSLCLCLSFLLYISMCLYVYVYAFVRGFVYAHT